MRHYTKITEDKKIELTTYPTETEDQVGIAMRLTKQEAKNLRHLLADAIEELEEESGE